MNINNTANSDKVVWILNHHAIGPNGNWGARHYLLAKNLIPHNWKGIVIAGESVSTDAETQDTSTFRTENFDDVSFLWLKTPAYSDGNLKKRVIAMVVYARRAVNRTIVKRLPKPDVVIGSCVHPLAGLAGAILAKRYGVPFIYEIRDLWPETLIQFGMIGRKSLPAIALRKLEEWLFKRSTVIISTLPAVGDYVVRYGIPREKVIWLPNGAELASFPDSPRVRQSEEPFTFMYFGAHGQANCLQTILDAYQILESRGYRGKIKLRMIGEGPLKQMLKEAAELAGLTNVTFENPVPKSTIPQVAAQADAFLITVKDHPGLYKYGISMNKLCDYMAAARPIVIGVDAKNDSVAESGGGISVPPNNPEKFADAMETLVNMDSDALREMGSKGRAYLAEHMDYARLGEKLAGILDRVTAKKV